MRIFRFVGLTWLAFTAVLANGQALSWAQVLNNPPVPLTYSLDDLPADFKAVQLSLSGSSGGIFEMMFGAMAGSLGAMTGEVPAKDAEQATGLLMMLHLTKGEEVEISGQKYLVSYKLSLKPDSKFVPTSGPPDPDGLEWHVTYVRSADIAQLTPLPNLKIKETLENLRKWRAGGSSTTTADPESDGATSPAERMALVNVKQVAIGLLMYATDNDDLMPGAQSTATFRALVLPYVKNKELLKTMNPNGGQLLYNVSLGSVSMTAAENVVDTVTLYDSQPWPNKMRPVSFLDGHAKWVDSDTWGKVKGSLLASYPRSGDLLPADYLIDLDPLKNP